MKWLATLAVSGLTAAALAAAVAAQEPTAQPPADPQAPVVQPEAPAEAGPRLIAASAVKLRVLDKITGNSTDINAKVGQSITHGRIKVTVRACYQSQPQDTPESATFLEVYSLPKETHGAAKPVIASSMNKGPQPIGENGLLFSGWMFASSPGLNALEHPTYDVWVINCITSAPQ